MGEQLVQGHVQVQEQEEHLEMVLVWFVYVQAGLGGLQGLVLVLDAVSSSVY